MTRINVAGLVRIDWVPVVANIAAPTVAEIAAGLELSNFLASQPSFGYDVGRIETPDLGSTFSSSIGGQRTTTDFELKLYFNDEAASAENLARVALAMGTSGYILRGFPVAGVKALFTATKKVEVWPVILTSNIADGHGPGEAQMVTVKANVHREPNTNATVTA